MKHYFQDIFNRVNQCSSEATLSLLGITQPGLRQHLHKIYAQPVSSQGGFLADPVFEPLFGWQEAETTMNDLANDLLDPALVEAMNQPAKKYRQEHAFKKEWRPYKHQLKTWKILCKEPPQSVVVTSGTGSGKTECFVVPVLNDLVKEQDLTQKPLIGTRALFVYPLNALINSQRDRLRAWTSTFENNIRFCLYNGNTKENERSIIQQETPNEILSRRLLRQEPAPILVTNATMLEYMMVRKIDSPILKASQKKLRWIVLDEAHTYIGSQAAELALLLRRVLHTFGVTAKDVRFIATSATMGKEEENERLQSYLASIAGIHKSQVSVVGGQRAVPPLVDSLECDDPIETIREIDTHKSYSGKRYKKLAEHKVSRQLRKTLTSKKRPISLSELASTLFAGSQGSPKFAQQTLAWLDLCSNTRDERNDKPAEPFLPLRGHLFHQVQSGLWSCSDSACTKKQGTPLECEWPFGYVYTRQEVRCSCGAPVYELVFCVECNAPHLKASDHGGRLVQSANKVIDEFSLQVEDEGNEDDEIIPQDTIILAPRENSGLTHPLSISKKDFSIDSETDTIQIHACDEIRQCAVCGNSTPRKTVFRSCLLGTPFYISNTIPSLLEFADDGKTPSELPGRGRRLITFTDSRQGTARIAAKIQQDSERDRIRGIIYAVIANRNEDDTAERIRENIIDYEEKAQKLKMRGLEREAGDFRKFAEQERTKLAALENPTVSWEKMVAGIRSNPDVNRWMFDYYNSQNPTLFPQAGGERTLAEMLLLREFARRPKRQNSLETLGLVGIVYPSLANITNPPSEWERMNLNSDDWKPFLKLALDFFVRENTIIDISSDWVNWMGAKLYPKKLLNPDSEERTSSQSIKWPLARSGRNNRLIRILAHYAKLDSINEYHRDLINQIMRAAWRTLTSSAKVLSQIPGTSHYHLQPGKMEFTLVKEGYICPVTQRIVDSTFKDITPYLPQHADGGDYRCEKITIPIYRPDTSATTSERERLQLARGWIESQDEIKKLRKQNLWTDLSDRIIEGGRYFRAAEHSAQQSASRLLSYEKNFKAGKLNVLSCSTTMEMGVDIGGFSQVIMNNVPPHPANYLQRMGRAGRRGESQALAFTICKDNPHDWSVFINPLWPFETYVPSPYVSLDSTRIVQRHINSLIIAYFFRAIDLAMTRETTALNCGWFFYRENEETPPVDHFIEWLGSLQQTGIPDFLKKGMRLLVIHTPFADTSLNILIDKAKQAVSEIKIRWHDEHQHLLDELEKATETSERDPYHRRIKRDIQSLEKEYLLSELVNKSFLPGYGFPTGIATFDPYNIHESIRRSQGNRREDNRGRIRDKPGRDLPIALREYSPGATVVLDGLVYKSAGISLNRFADANITENQLIRIEYRCGRCGHIDNAAGATFGSTCGECGARIQQDNIRRYLQPTGFAVDFYAPPTTDISSRPFIKTQDPWVTASGEWHPLSNSKLGVYRSSTDGHIFHHVSGENGTGYAICLRCGRADSMTEKREFPDRLRPNRAHKRLRGMPYGEESANCDGPDTTHLIVPGLHLGHVDQTDVFELFLKRPLENQYLHYRKEIDDTKRLAWTLAVVLRQSLADCLGINASEIGYMVKPSFLPDCSYPATGVVLFDECSGGAGFSSSAWQYLTSMFQKAHRYLECSAKCHSACQACLVGHDTRFHLDLLNRHIALEYLNDDFFDHLE